MKEDFTERVKTLQTLMVDSGELCLAGTEPDNVRCVIRITVEFSGWLRKANLGSLDDFSRRDCIETVFSGIPSYSLASSAYRVLVGAKPRAIEWGTISLPSLKEQFNTTFQRFLAETDPVKKFRLLLDLYNVQIVFAGLLYD